MTGYDRVYHANTLFPFPEKYAQLHEAGFSRGKPHIYIYIYIHQLPNISILIQTIYIYIYIYIYIICVPTRNRNNEFILEFILRKIKMADFER